MKLPLAAAAAVIVLCLAWLQPFDFGRKEVTIPRGASSREIGRLLAAENVLRSESEFTFWVRILGKEKKLRYGAFELARYKNPFYMIARLTLSPNQDIAVTIPEGLTVDETSRILEVKGLVDSRTFLRLCTDRTLIAQLGLESKSLEGYLFPDTYFFNEAQSETAIVRVMVANFQNRLKRLGPVVSDRLPGIVTLASIVEKEAQHDDERPVIAGVFLNRMRLNRPLESCATVIYALRASDRRAYEHYSDLTEADLKTPSPYNTYLHGGLPPGPICSPGERSLEAAINPARTDYLYFVLKGDGRHHFSRTYKEHRAAQASFHAQN